MGDHSNADFGGYATKAGIQCTDGRTIMPHAFTHMDGKQIPLVYNHDHKGINQVLGHAILEARPDGVYAYGYFNQTDHAKNAREYVQHKDIRSLSIYATKLTQNHAKQVLHGEIREVSLVLAGANPGAKIDFVQIKHSELDPDDPDYIQTLDDEAVIHMDEPLELTHSATATATKETAPAASSDAGSGETIEDVYNTLSDKQKNVVSYMIGAALEEAGDAQHDALEDDEEDDEDEGAEDDEETEDDDDDETDVSHREGTGTVNVFEQAKKNGTTMTGVDGSPAVRHMVGQDDLEKIYKAAKRYGSLNEALEEYTLAHGIESIESLFPDPKLLNNTPDFNSRNMAWVQNVLDKTRKSPFSRIKSIVADITQDEARAKGYITGNFKKEEWFNLVSRTTTPTTVYKKQKLDRDNVLDIVDFDVVAWLKGEMRIMLSEEIAVAILLGDGREVDDEDHIADPKGDSSGAGIRSIMNDDELYVTRVTVNIDDANSDASEIVDQVLMASEFYKGTGSPSFYSTQRMINFLLLSKDLNGRRNYDNMTALAAAMGVSDVVAVEPMNRFPTLVGIVVNLTDYNVGTDRGGEVNMFDQFDIDYNQMKYLMETRCSGALVKIKSAMVIMKTASSNVVVVPNAPTFVASTGVVTIVATTGVVYKNADTDATLSTGVQTALAAGASLDVVATPAAGYYFAVSGTPGIDEWTFKRPSA
jgi:hypothetical protein